MKTQPEKLAKLLTRKSGVTSLEIILSIGTVCPHRRMSDLKERGWIITSRKVAGKNYSRYFGRMANG